MACYTIVLTVILVILAAQPRTSVDGRPVSLPSPSAVFMLGNMHDDTIYQFLFDSEGLLVLQRHPVVHAGPGVSSFEATHNGDYLYVSDYNRPSISQFRIDSRGALSPLSPSYIASSAADVISVGPNDKYLYALQSQQDEVTTYRIGKHGRLAVAGTTKIPDPIPLNIVIDPKGRFAYVICQLGMDPPSGTREIDEFRIEPNGELKSLEPTYVDDFGGFGAQMFANSGGTKLYVADGAGISQYLIQTNGQLKYVRENGYSSPSEVMAAIDEKYNMIIGIGGDNPQQGESASQIILTAVGRDGGLMTRNVYNIDRLGGLSQPVYQPPQAVPPITPAAPLNPADEILPEPTCVTIDQKSQILYVLDARSYNIFRYAINPGGDLIELKPPVVSGHAPQPPDTPNLSFSSFYYPPTFDYVLIIRRSESK